MFRKNGIQWVLFTLIIFNLSLSLWSYLRTPKIAYVRSQVLVKDYRGMKEAQRQFEIKSNEWKKNLDTLYIIYNSAVKLLENNKDHLNLTEIKKLREDAFIKQSNYQEYKNYIESLASKENDKLTQGALNQINSYIEQYAKEHQIDLIIGVTISGNVLYGENNIDITEEILEGLNDNYK